MDLGEPSFYFRDPDGIIRNDANSLIRNHRYREIASRWTKHYYEFDLSSLGALLERRTDNEPHFLSTPKGASVFGWTGVDGIHLLILFVALAVWFLPGQPGEHISKPCSSGLAKNFADFLCGLPLRLAAMWQH